MLRIEKIGGKKVIFKNFFAKSQKIFSWQRNLCQVFFSLPRVFNLALGKEVCVPSVFI
jgi:hypothetical protein